MTLKADGTRPDLHGTLRISAHILSGRIDPAWALLEETADGTFTGWSVYGPGDFSDACLPSLEDGDEPTVCTFAEVSNALPDLLELLDWGNGEFPLLMEAWMHRGVRKWMPWEDFSKYADEAGPAGG